MTEQTVVETRAVARGAEAGKLPEHLALAQTFKLLLPAAQGNLCLWGGQRMQNIWVPTQGDLVELACRVMSDRHSWYFGTAVWGDTRNAKGEIARTQANVLAKLDFYHDWDCGYEKFKKNPQGAYATKEEGLAAIAAFTKATGLVPTLIVFSGAGWHTHYALDQDITPEQWKPRAEALGAKARELGFRVDPSVTTDSARVLRLPGSRHQNGNRAFVYRNTGRIWTLAELDAKLGTADVAVATSRRAKLDVNGMLPKFEGPPVSAIKIAEHCAALRHVAELRGDCPEPEWRATIGVVKFCVEGADLAHEWSRGHPSYDERETQAKYDRYAGTGPTLCTTWEKLNPKACAACQHHGNIKSPIVLGRHAPALVAALSGDEANEAAPTTPVPAQPAEGGADKMPKSGAEAARAAGMRPIRSKAGQYFLVSESGGRREVLPFDSSDARDRIALVLRRARVKPTEAAIDNVVSELRGQVLESGERVEVHLRTAAHEGAYYSDKGDGRAVHRVSPGRVETIPAIGAPYFAPGTGAGVLPDPVVPDTSADAFETLGTFFGARGVPEVRRLPLIVALLEAFRPDTPHPVINLIGAAGSGKSTTMQCIQQLIDPTDSGALADTKLDARDITAAAQHRHLLAVDNASHLSADTQDFACKISTGATVTVRAMYTNAGVDSLSIHRPLVITSIGAVGTRGDLADRTVLVELPSREGFQSSEELRAGFEARRPALFGALLRLLADAMVHLPAVRERMARLPVRLVDFAQLGEAVCIAAGIEGGFVGPLRQMRRASARVTAGSDAFLIALQQVFERWESRPRTAVEHPSARGLERGDGYSVVATAGGGLSIRCTAGAVEKALPRLGMSRELARWLPATSRGVGDAMRRVEPVMRELGWRVSTEVGRVTTFDIEVGPDWGECAQDDAE